MTTRNVVGVIVIIVAVLGALNWGLIGFFNFNVIDAVFGGGVHEETSGASRIIYAIVGLCGIAALFFLPGTKSTTRREAELHA